jgi:dihydroxyacid dehydratase/phosphogluconate dehydratase
MLHLRAAGLLRTDARTVSGRTLGENLDWWEKSARRARLRARLRELDGIDAGDVIMSPESARSRGLTSTITFLRGNLAPEGAVVKSTAIAPELVGPDGVFHHRGPARVFTSESAAIAAVKAGRLQPGDVLVLIGIGPGSGMPETYQITSALKHLRDGQRVALVTDGRFSGVSTGACVGHVSPDAWSGGPIGRVRDGDVIELRIDTRGLRGEVNLESVAPDELAARGPHPGLKPDPRVPADTRLWAALQAACGGTWGGCVHDAERVAHLLELGLAAEQAASGRSG